LAEDDYHAIATDVIGWTNRELYRLFDEHAVLMPGMSLDDPNVRRVLSALHASRRNNDTKHFALMRQMTRPGSRLEHADTNYVTEYIYHSNAVRKWFWRQHGVHIIELPEYESTLPFLTRVRYESYGSKPGDLWREGVKLGYHRVDPWGSERQHLNRLLLSGACDELAEKFGANRDEILEMGIFLLMPDCITLELVFRGGGAWSAVQGATTFSADPDAPTGVAGRVFVSGDLVRIPSNHELHDYGLPGSRESTKPNYAGIISVPITDWQHGGVPVGVIYVTTSTTEGGLFDLQPKGVGQPTLFDLYDYLERLGLSIVRQG
jgi:hypothetical protein